MSIANSIVMPKPIAAYFAADQKDGAAIAACFTEDATVVDERQSHQGRDAIGRWKIETTAKFTYSVEPLAIYDEGKRTVVTARLTGNFPGSPVDLRYAFVLDGDAIARLEIVP